MFIDMCAMNSVFNACRCLFQIQKYCAVTRKRNVRDLSASSQTLWYTVHAFIT